MDTHIYGRRPSGLREALAVVTAVLVFQLLGTIPPVQGADIGVLSDGRQVEYLSLLGSSGAAARTALLADGHVVNTLPSLNPSVTGQVAVVWLPLLQTGETYTVQERIWLFDLVQAGGRVVWIGDADVYNNGDDSFLSAFGSSKLIGNLDAGLTPAPAWASHPVVTGPHGSVAAVGQSCGYGLFTEAPGMAAVFTGENEEEPPQSGVFAGFIGPEGGHAGTGRVVLIGDASVFGQNLDQVGQDHRALLRNAVKWVAAAPGYTPSGTQVNTGYLAGACAACTGVALTFDAVMTTGETAAAPLGSGRCGFAGIPHGDLPADFVGYGFIVETTAGLPDEAAITLTITYGEAALSALGIPEAALRLYHFPAAGGPAIEVAGTLDTTANLISGVVADVGRFLLGGIVAAPDCNANGVPDECDIDAGDPDGDGAFSRDCNGDGIPDECEIASDSTAPGGPFYCTADCTADCNNNGIPDACDLDAGDPDGDGAVSTDCNSDGVPDECQPGLPPAIQQQPADQAVCVGSPVTFSVQAAGAATLEYQWRKNSIGIPEATGPTYAIAAAAPADAGVYDVVITSACGQVISNGATLVVHVGPTITQPPTAQSVCPGSAASFTVAAAGTGDVTYRWHKDGLPLDDDGGVTGTTTAVLTIDPVAAGHAGYYACALADDCGSVTTVSAALDVGAPPQITAQPVDLAVCPGDPAAFAVGATGAQLSYQWQFDGGSGFTDLTNGGSIAGATTPALTISGVSSADAGGYRCIVDGACGDPVDSASAVLSVGVPTEIESGPTDAFACLGDSASFSVVAAGTNLAYRWLFDAGSGYQYLTDGVEISGAHTATLTLSTVTAGRAGPYCCVVTGDCGGPLTTSAATLAVGTFPAILDGPVDRFVCPGGNVSFNVIASGTGRTYQWQFDGGAGFADLADGDGLSGAQTPTLLLTGASATMAGLYRCVISGSCGDPLASAVALLTVGQVVSIQQPPTDCTVCPGAQAVFTVVASGTDLAYQWQFNGGTIGGATDSTLVLDSADATDQGQYRCVVYGACGTPVTSASATLTVTIGACDCNGNGQHDADDIAAGISADCNGNGIPDECDLDPTDPDGNGQVSADCNANGTPDECDIAAGTSADCNGNGEPDECDLASGASADCNGNGIPDSCDIAAGTSADCNGNGVPDECDPPYIAEAGDSQTVCVGMTTTPLGGYPVASGSTPPYTYTWEIISGPSGGGMIFQPNSEHPRFYATLVGTYELRVTVADSSPPPCVTADTVQITVVGLTIDAGLGFTTCVGATSGPLSPTTSGGSGSFTYSWTIEASSPDVSPAQFTGAGPLAAGPTFTPAAPGYYTLCLTVQDVNSPFCTSTDTLVIHAVSLAIAPPVDFALCLGSTSAPLLAQILQTGTPPQSYVWSVEPGSPAIDPAQFTGDGPFSATPTFSPSAPGLYILRVTVRDSGTPPCEETATFRVTAGTLSVDAGANQTTCVGGAGVRLAPLAQGGAGGVSYTWSIEPGSPSTAVGQFTDPNAYAASPLFIPTAPGDYVLRVTVRDAGAPACVATDTVLIQATRIQVNAGADFTTQVFRPSPPLGGVPVAQAVVPPATYAWRIVSGPSLETSQWSAVNVEHPVFTPAAAGSYVLGVKVTDAYGAACAVEDTVFVSAVAATLTMPVNTEGRVFMRLQLGGAHERAEVIIAGGTPGEIMTGELRDDGTGANINGLLATPSISRRLAVTAPSRPPSFIAVVVMYYGEGEPGGAVEGDLRVHRLNTGKQWWQPASPGFVETGRYPSQPLREDLGRQGIDPSARCVWAVLTYVGEFAIGVPSGEEPPAGAQNPGGDSSGGATLPPAEDVVPAIDDGLLSPASCGAAGACGAGSAVPLALTGLAGWRRRRRGR